MTELPAGAAPGTSPDEMPRCTDPGELREHAAANRGRVALLKLEAMNLDREADQLEHEAALWETADAADDALDELREKTAGLEAAAEGKLAAERLAQDTLREDKKHLARRRAEVARAESSGSRDAQDDAAARLSRSGQRVDAAEKALAGASKQRQDADEVLDAHRGQLREAQAACARALQAGMNPGVAARKSPLALGLGRPEDMTPEEKSLVAMVAISGMTAGSAGAAGGSEQPRRNRFTTNGEFAAQDPSKFRMVRQGSHVIAVPPAR
jgi:hypothetical protein